MKTEFDVKSYLKKQVCLKTKSLLLATIFIIAFQYKIVAQEQRVLIENDTILPVNLDEVIVISSYKNALEHKTQNKPLSTLDEYLEASKKLSMIKRGAYAWEPVLNDMSSERLTVSIDGMRIFGACTDKMDPITSYVDVSNLTDIHIAGGQQGAEHGSTIGGSIDLRLEKSNFKPTGWLGSFETGYESNNAAKIIGGELNYSSDAFYIDSGVIFRKAENYVAGGGEEVNYSQFEKYNLSTNAGFKIDNDKKLLASFIFDEARDVGYPALPMDVSLARAFIGSLSWFQSDFIGEFSDWDSKIYANSITHIMDDSKRPDVPIRMDMPGWSNTYGYYSQAKLKLEKHAFLFKIDGFYNKSLAEMTMYPNDPNENEMFMLTWPDVRTLNSGLYAEDVFNLKKGTLKISSRMTIQGFNIADEFGLNSLRIFYPDMEQRQTRFLKSFSTLYATKLEKTNLKLGLSYGDRAPTVSEGFGFYLFNSFDNHDYIGDPDLKNEKSVEGNVKLLMPFKNFKLNLEGNYFHTMDYIIGEVSPDLSVMTIGADGVKIYKNLDFANLYNISLDGTYQVTPNFSWNGFISYHRGQDQDQNNLPFISPFSYKSSIQYVQGSFSGNIAMNGASEQVNFNPSYGEDQTKAYTIFSISLGKTISIADTTLYLKTGVENIFDTNYSTYADWKNIPRMGRNMFLTCSYTIN